VTARKAVPEHVAVYRRIRAVFGDPQIVTRDGRRRAAKADSTEESSTPFAKGRDPRELGAVLDRLTSQMGWNSDLARSELIVSWREIVGAETAEHCEPIGIEDGVLAVRCDSTAWAQQLRNMRTMIVTRIAEMHPAAGIESVNFLGPVTPSWKRGPRAIPGRGPRDTYG